MADRRYDQGASAEGRKQRRADSTGAASYEHVGLPAGTGRGRPSRSRSSSRGPSCAGDARRGRGARSRSSDDRRSFEFDGTATVTAFNAAASNAKEDRRATGRSGREDSQSS